VLLRRWRIDAPIMTKPTSNIAQAPTKKVPPAPEAVLK
jgi:hypothetical protein